MLEQVSHSQLKMLTLKIHQYLDRQVWGSTYVFPVNNDPGGPKIVRHELFQKDQAEKFEMFCDIENKGSLIKSLKK